jgi:S1-C subfamily serine protease
VGVTSQIQSDSGGNEGVGFAIPSNTVKSIVGQLISSGKAEHAYLGVTLATIPSSASSRLGLPTGVEIDQVKSGTPASKAGLRGATGSHKVAGQSYPTGGDVVTALDGKRIATAEALRSAVESKQPGDTVSLTYSRGGKSHTVQIRLANRPA